MPQCVRTLVMPGGDVSIAYQVLGDGPFDLILAPGFVSNVEYGWEEPTLEHWPAFVVLPPDHLRQARNRALRSGERCTGSGDKDGRHPRDHGCRRLGTAALLGYSEGAAMAAVFAATYPERTPALVLWDHFLSPESLFSHGPYATVEQQLDELARGWGTPEYCDELLRADARPRPTTQTSAAGTRPGCASARARRRPSL